MADNNQSAGPAAPSNKRQRDEREDSRGGSQRRNKRSRGSFASNNRGGQRRTLGRNEYSRSNADRRGKNERNNTKKPKADDPTSKPAEVPNYVIPFTSEEIAAEKADGRQPKRKVAVMIGYSGTGYKGMQIMPSEKTIEGDLFAAFVKAGAISKANADDPKKSSLIRCARTDKGVHAAGNVISLKLIIEDPDIVAKINAELSPQIRVWAIERTKGSFSCYHACDSRWYEYLIPTHCFLPPHPSSYLGRNLVEVAEEAGDLENYKQRQKEVLDFWPKVDEERVKPILDSLDENTRAIVEKALYLDLEASGTGENGWNADAMIGTEEGDVDEGEGDDRRDNRAKGKGNSNDRNVQDSVTASASEKGSEAVAEAQADGGQADPELQAAQAEVEQDPAIKEAIKSLKAAYSAAKHAYRISPERLQRVKEVFAKYTGTHNFHNFTVRKGPRDPSAKRHIKSFAVNETPIIINDTEWLSLKVHGQSFMMHQIRKMVGMATLLVRCGTPLERLDESMRENVFSIPKVPGLGLLLERPVFDSYNTSAKEQFEREAIDFSRYDDAIEEFKRREIYDRIFREEAEGNVFHTFFSHIDNFKDQTFLYLTSKGLAASGMKQRAVPEMAPPMSKQERVQRAQERRRNWESKHQRSNADGSTLQSLAAAAPDAPLSSEHARVAPHETGTTNQDSNEPEMNNPKDAAVSTDKTESVSATAPSIGAPSDVKAVSSEKSGEDADGGGGAGASAEMKSGVEERIEEDK